MITIILKWIIGSGVFIGIYRLLLQREAMFRFNRVYLLVTLMVALILPFIDISSIDMGFGRYMPVKNGFTAAMEAVPGSGSISGLEKMLWGIGGAVSLAFLLRFVMNLKKMYQLVKANDTIKSTDHTIVLLNEPIAAFSFHKYMFITKADINNDFEQSEVFMHEYAHIRQRHTWDLIFIELVKVFFWFNPFVYLYRKYIMANHEYLADKAVLKNLNIEVATYQYKLLDAIAQSPKNPLSHHFYAATKKRLLIMGKHTPYTKKSLLTSLALLIMGATFMLLANSAELTTKAIANNITNSFTRWTPIEPKKTTWKDDDAW